MHSNNKSSLTLLFISRRATLSGMAAAALSASIERARATEWPVRPVTVIVPYSPGGNTDMMARLAAQYLADKLGQSFVVENRPGGGGSVGAIAVARAQPDGYTMLFGASTQIINIPMLQKVAYDPPKDFVPISVLGAGPYLLGIKSSLPAKTLAEFVAFVKANPGKLNYATAGIGGNVHLNTALFVARAGLDMVAVPYKSGAPAMAGLAGGEVENVFRQRLGVDAAHREQANPHPRNFNAAANSAASRCTGSRRNLSRVRHVFVERFLRAVRNSVANSRSGGEVRHCSRERTRNCRAVRTSSQFCRTAQRKRSSSR